MFTLWQLNHRQIISGESLRLLIGRKSHLIDIYAIVSTLRSAKSTYFLSFPVVYSR